MKNIIITFLFLLIMGNFSYSQLLNDDPCKALEIPCVQGGYPQLIQTISVNQLASIASFGTNYAISGAQCVNLPYAPTVFYKVTVNVAGKFTFSVRIGHDNFDNNGVFYSQQNESFHIWMPNYAVWKNVDCNDIKSGNAPYPLRISANHHFSQPNNCVGAYCGGVTGLDISEPVNNFCEDFIAFPNGVTPSNNGRVKDINVVPGDVIIIAINNFPIITNWQSSPPTGPPGPVPTPIQIIVGGQWGGDGDIVKCCTQYNLTDKQGNVKSQFCLGEKVFLKGQGLASSSFKINLLSANNTLLDSKSFTNSSPDGLEITSIFPSTGSTFKFQPALNYKINLEGMSPCGCFGVFLDFNFICCNPDDPSIQLFSIGFKTTGSPPTLKLVGSGNYSGNFSGTNFVWKVWGVSPQSGNILPSNNNLNNIVFQTNTKDFAWETGGTCFYVQYSMENECFGPICSSKRFCSINCDDKECNLSAPQNLSFINGRFSWNPVPNATSYIIQLTFCDPSCCGVSGSGAMSSNNVVTLNKTGTFYDFDPMDIPGLTPSCFSWKVSAVCPDNTRSMWGIPATPCVGGATEGCSSPLGRGFNNTVVPKNTIINENTGTLVKLYPNPTSGLVSIDISVDEDVEFDVSVYDRTGSKVIALENLKTIERKANVKWNAEHLSKGIYLVKVSTSNNQVLTKILTIE